MFLYYLFWYLCFLHHRIEMGEVCNNGAPLRKKEKNRREKKRIALLSWCIEIFLTICFQQD